MKPQKGRQVFFCWLPERKCTAVIPTGKTNMDDPNDQVVTEPQAPSQVVINGTEYSPEEAQQLIDTGRKTREYEQKWNTKLDNVWPEYGRLTQERTNWQSEKQKLEDQVRQFQAKQTQGTDTEAELQQAREAARKLGIPLKEDLEKEGYIRRTDLDKMLAERDEQQKAVQAILSEAEKLEKEINATEAPAKFHKKSVLAYAQAYGYNDLRKAYEDMNEDVLKPWKEAQIAAGKKPGLKTLKPTGGVKEPKEGKVDDNNVKDLLKETLWGAGQ